MQQTWWSQTIQKQIYVNQPYTEQRIRYKESNVWAIEKYTDEKESYTGETGEFTNAGYEMQSYAASTTLQWKCVTKGKKQNIGYR